jgi:hypothetical protein
MTNIDWLSCILVYVIRVQIGRTTWYLSRFGASLFILPPAKYHYPQKNDWDKNVRSIAVQILSNFSHTKYILLFLDTNLEITMNNFKNTTSILSKMMYSCTPYSALISKVTKMIYLLVCDETESNDAIVSKLQARLTIKSEIGMNNTGLAYIQLFSDSTNVQYKVVIAGFFSFVLRTFYRYSFLIAIVNIFNFNIVQPFNCKLPNKLTSEYVLTYLYIGPQDSTEQDHHERITKLSCSRHFCNDHLTI